MSVDPDMGSEARLLSAGEHARVAWRQVRLHLRAITPSGLAHALLLVVAVGTIVWMVVASWPALLPFVAGGVMAYTVLPIVNRLDRIMPRPLAVLLTMAAVVLLLVLIMRAVIPPLAREVQHLYLALPSVSEVQLYLEHLDTYTSTLPDPVRSLIQREADIAVTNLRAGLDQYLDHPLDAFFTGLRGIVNSVGFVLGFFVLPAWLLAILNDQQTGARALDRLLPRWFAPDFWAVVRILDRIFGAFVRGRIVIGLAVGIGTWLGLTVLDAFYGQSGVQAGEYAILLALLVGILQLVPTIGPLFSAILSGLIGLTFSPRVALLVLVIWVLVQQIVGRTVTPRVERRVVDLHPAILVMAITALSQFGFAWVFIAAPLVAVTRDLFRYLYGRVADPPLPPGILPGSPEYATAAAADTAGTAPPIPLVYRRTREARRS